MIARILVANDDTSEAEYKDMAAKYEQLQTGSGLEPEAFQRLCSTVAAHWREWGKVLGIPTAGRIDFGNLEGRAAQAVARKEEQQGNGAAKATALAPRGGTSPDGAMHIWRSMTIQVRSCC